MKKLLDYYATWCVPCKTMAPTIEELEKEYTIEKFDVDTQPERAANYNVMSVPTYIILEDDKEVQRFVGAVSKEVLKQALL